MDKRTTIIKTVTWRAIAVSITFAVTFAVTGSFEAAGTIGGIDTVIKMAAYYAHERGWAKLLARRAAAAETASQNPSHEVFGL